MYPNPYTKIGGFGSPYGLPSFLKQPQPPKSFGPGGAISSYQSMMGAGGLTSPWGAGGGQQPSGGQGYQQAPMQGQTQFQEQPNAAKGFGQGFQLYDEDSPIANMMRLFQGPQPNGSSSKGDSGPQQGFGFQLMANDSPAARMTSFFGGEPF